MRLGPAGRWPARMLMPQQDTVAAQTYRLIAELEHFACQISSFAQLDAHVALDILAEVGPLLGPVDAGPGRRLALAAADAQLVDWHQQAARLLVFSVLFAAY